MHYHCCLQHANATDYSQLCMLPSVRRSIVPHCGRSRTAQSRP